jgi:hypothetical protein
MKTLFLFTLTLLLTINLSARENPFEATNAYEEEEARIIEQNEIDENAINEQAYIKEMQQKMSSNMQNENKNKVEEAVKKLVPALKVEKTYTKKEVKRLIKKAQKQSEVKAKKILKEELSKTKSLPPEQIIYVKPRTDIVGDSMMKSAKLLDFVTVSYNDDKLTIYSNDKLDRKFTLKNENKIIIDYKARKNFYTKRANLDSTNFKKLAIGNHKDEKFYRVVVKLAKDPSSYKVDYKNKLLTIIQINKI